MSDGTANSDPDEVMVTVNSRQEPPQEETKARFMPIPSDGRFVDVAGDVAFEPVDILEATFQITEDEIVTTITVASIPEELTFNGPDIFDSSTEYEWSVHVDIDADDRVDYSISITHAKLPDEPMVTGDILSNTFHWAIKYEFDGLLFAGNWVSDVDASIEGNTFRFVVERAGELTEITEDSRVRFIAFYVFGTGPSDEVSHSDLLQENQATDGDGVEAIEFADPNLEAAVREAIGKSTGSILPSDVSSLEVLLAGSWNISNLQGIEQLTQLTALLLTRNQISDVSPLSDLTQLTVLLLSNNQISDVSPLSGLTQLTELDLRSNQISDVSPLSGLTQLTVLLLSNNQISDVSPLSGLTQLTLLMLDGNQISDVSPLVDNEGLGEGDTVDLQGNPLSDEALTTQIPALQARGVEERFDEIAVPEPAAIVFADLNLEIAVREAIGKSTGSISPSDVSSLQVLDAQIQNISNLQGIEQLTQLVRLELFHNQITDVSPLSGLTQLSELFLTGNQISDVSQLSGLTQVETLLLAVNQISDVSPLSDLTQLRSLHLDGNQITDVSPLSGLTQLTELSLSRNQITDVSPLSGLIQLTWIGLSDNQISDVSPLSDLTQLGSLLLDGNQISDVSALVDNVGLREGDTVDLQGNPLSDEALTTQIPALQTRGVEVEFDETSVPEPGNEITQAYNLLINPSADEDTRGWIFFGNSGVDVIGDNNKVFYVEESEDVPSHIFQDVELPPLSAGKFLLLIGYAWVEDTVAGSITRHPYLYGYEMNSSSTILNYLQGQQMRHTAGERTWQTISAIFQLEPDALVIRFFLNQASMRGDPPDGTRAVFDDLELLIFETQDEAEAHREIYKANHPEVLIQPTSESGVYVIALSECDANHWFGGDDRSEAGARNVGVGQSVVMPNSGRARTAGFRFTMPWQFASNGAPANSAATLKLNVRDEAGAIIDSSVANLDSGFSGEWVRFDIDTDMMSGKTYIFTCYLENGEELEFNTGVCGHQEDRLAGFGYSAMIRPGDDIRDWSNWMLHAWDFNFELTYTLTE